MRRRQIRVNASTHQRNFRAMLLNVRRRRHVNVHLGRHRNTLIRDATLTKTRLRRMGGTVLDDLRKTIRMLNEISMTTILPLRLRGETSDRAMNLTGIKATTRGMRRLILLTGLNGAVTRLNVCLLTYQKGGLVRLNSANVRVNGVNMTLLLVRRLYHGQRQGADKSLNLQCTLTPQMSPHNPLTKISLKSDIINLNSRHDTSNGNGLATLSSLKNITAITTDSSRKLLTRAAQARGIRFAHNVSVQDRNNDLTLRGLVDQSRVSRKTATDGPMSTIRLTLLNGYLFGRVIYIRVRFLSYLTHGR